MELRTPLVLLIGAQAREAWQVIAPYTAGCEAAFVPCSATATQWLADVALRQNARHPALIVVLQAWPGQIMAQEVARWRELAPLARIWELAESWCEGAPRTGVVLPGVLRIYRHQWPQRGARELARLAAGQNSSWSLAPTATMEEHLLAENIAALAEGLVAVVVNDRESGEAISECLRAAGLVVRLVTEPARNDAGSAPAAEAGVIVWDTSAEAAADSQRVARVRALGGTGPIIALWGFVRQHEVQHAQAAGVAAVVSKPFLAADMLWQINALLGTKRSTADFSA